MSPGGCRRPGGISSPFQTVALRIYAHTPVGGPATLMQPCYAACLSGVGWGAENMRQRR